MISYCDKIKNLLEARLVAAREDLFHSKQISFCFVLLLVFVIWNAVFISYFAFISHSRTKTLVLCILTYYLGLMK